MRVTMIASTQDPVQTIEKAASVCYDSVPSPEGRIMKSCIMNGHESVTEHTIFTYLIEGVSRNLLAQLTRHRIGTAYSVRSQRYCSESGFQTVVPHTINNNTSAKEIYDVALSSIRFAYDKMVQLGIPAEDARYILPGGCYTTIVFSANLRELRHICAERLCSRAQWEIREMMRQIVAQTTEQFPELSPYLVPKCERNPKCPFCPEQKSCGRHPKLSEVYAEYNKNKKGE